MTVPLYLDTRMAELAVLAEYPRMTMRDSDPLSPTARINVSGVDDVPTPMCATLTMCLLLRSTFVVALV